MWSAQYYNYKRPRQFITSGGLGAMGFGLPSAMGAKVACPNELVVNIDGDGSFQMNIQELGTVHSEGIDIKMIIANNQHLGMVAQWEDRFYGSCRGNTVMKNSRIQRPYPDFVTIAKGYGIPGKEVYKKDELEDAIIEMIETKGPFLLDVHVEYQEHVLPMIPPGKNHTGIILK
jgi:acetolactate synthase-1/2/3 large subunit